MFDGQDEQRHKGAKQSIDTAAGLSRRQAQSASIRTKAREGALEKKRRQVSSGEPDTELRVNGDPTNPWSYDRNTHPSQVPLSLLPQFVQLVNSNEDRERLQGVLLIRKLLAAERSAPLQEVIDTNVAPILVHCMSHPDCALQFEASWALSNIASGSSAQAEYIMGLNPIPLWIQHLSSASRDCQEQATLALGNLAGEGARCRDYILASGAMEPLLLLIDRSSSGSSSLLQSAVWALSNFCRFNPPSPIDSIRRAVPVFVQMLHHSDIEVAVDASWSLSHICDGPAERIQLVVDCGALPAISKMLSSDESRFTMPAIRTLGSICAGTDAQVQAAVNAGCLPPLAALLHPSKPRGVRKEVAWTLSNIGAGTQHHIQCIIHAGLVPRLLSTLLAFEVEVKKEAAWAWWNIVSKASSQQLSFLVECEVLDALCEVLNSSGDPKILTVILETILMLLENGEELVEFGYYAANPYSAHIESFQGDTCIDAHIAHADADVRSLVGDIMQRFFDHETVPVASADTEAVLGSGVRGTVSDAAATQFWDNAAPQGGFNF